MSLQIQKFLEKSQNLFFLMAEIAMNLDSEISRRPFKTGFYKDP